MSDSSEQPATFVAPDLAELAPHFPGYEFEGLIATGGMGAVYRAIQKSLERRVAIKILPREFSQDSAFCACFEAEAKAMARLNHPNLIGVFDFGEVAGMPYIIMEFVPGESLFHASHGQAMEPAKAIKLISGICHGLAHAHTHGIIHRDIKPSNILLDLNAQPKIGDFGLARPVEKKIGDGEEIFGTPHYTAPEVCDSPGSVDYRADIFSVGVLLHELLTGRLPAEDSRPASVIVHCDPRIDTIIRCATDPLPKRRYANALELANDLSAISSPSGQPTRQRIPAPTPGRNIAGRPKPVVREDRHSGMWGIALVVMAVIIGITAYKQHAATQEGQRIIPEESPKEQASDTQSPPKTRAAPPRKNRSETVPESPGSQDPAMDTNPNDHTSREGADDVAAEPKFDVSGFFERGRKNLRDRAAPVFAKHTKSLKDNYWNFEKGVLTRANKATVNRAQAVAQVTKTLAAMNNQKNRVPVELDESLAEIQGVPEIYLEMLEKQKAIDTMLRREINELAPTYILGLGKQIERLKTDNDPPAVTLIEEEIAKTRNQADYFSALLLGDTLPMPPVGPPPEEDDKPAKEQ